MANSSSLFVIFTNPGVQLAVNGLGGGTNAINSVSTLPDGTINTTDTVIGTSTTLQSVFSIINTTSKIIPAAGIFLGGVAASRAIRNINDNLNEKTPVAVSDIAALGMV